MTAWRSEEIFRAVLHLRASVVTSEDPREARPIRERFTLGLSGPKDCVCVCFLGPWNSTGTESDIHLCFISALPE